MAGRCRKNDISRTTEQLRIKKSSRKENPQDFITSYLLTHEYRYNTLNISMKLFQHAQQGMHKIASNRYSNVLLFMVGFSAILILLLVAVKGIQDTRSEAKEVPGGGRLPHAPTPKKFWDKDKYPIYIKPKPTLQGIFRNDTK